MKEPALRKTHGYLGITLAFFLLLQGGSGLLLSATEVLEPVIRTISQEAHGHAKEPGETLAGIGKDAHAEPQEAHQVARHGLLGRVHHPQGTIWNLYRIAVGGGLIMMLASGTMIFLKTRARTPKNRRNEPAEMR